jgi:hypothetical protein
MKKIILIICIILIMISAYAMGRKPKEDAKNIEITKETAAQKQNEQIQFTDKNFTRNDEISLQEISLDEFIEDYQPNYELYKEIQLEGVGKDFAVAKETGDIVAVTKSNHQFIVKMYNIDGECNWTLEFDEKYRSINPRISENGETITLFLQIYEGWGDNLVISNNGDVLFSVKKSAHLIPSPTGSFIYENYSAIEGIKNKEIVMYDRNGERVEISGLEKFERENIRIRFIDSSHLIVFFSTRVSSYNNDIPGIQFLFCNFNNSTIDVVWQFELEKGHQGLVFDYLTTQNVKISKRFITLTTSHSGSYVFDYNGKILYQENNPIPPLFYFSQQGDLMIYGKENIKIFDNNFNKISNINYSLKEIEEKEDILSFHRFDNYYLFDIKRFQWQKQKYHTLLLEYSNSEIKQINEEFHFLNINASSVMIVVEYEPNTSIRFLSKGGRK